MKTPAAAMIIALCCACVPLPDYAGRRLAVPDGGEAVEQMEEEDPLPADAHGNMQPQQGPHDTGVAAVPIDASIADEGVSDAEEVADAGEPQQQQPPPDAGTPPMTGAAFGAACATDADCASNVCRTFGQLGLVCTALCTTDNQCPVGSQGQKCNQQGLCRP